MCNADGERKYLDELESFLIWMYPVSVTESESPFTATFEMAFFS